MYVKMTMTMTQEEIFFWSDLEEIIYREHPRIFLTPCDCHPSNILHYFPPLTQTANFPPVLHPAPHIIYSRTHFNIDNEIFWLFYGVDYIDILSITEEIL